MDIVTKKACQLSKTVDIFIAQLQPQSRVTTYTSISTSEAMTSLFQTQLICSTAFQPSNPVTWSLKFAQHFPITC